MSGIRRKTRSGIETKMPSLRATKQQVQILAFDTAGCGGSDVDRVILEVRNPWMHVSATKTHRDFLASLGSDKYDLVVMTDSGMNLIEVVELSEHVRHTQPKATVILISKEPRKINFVDHNWHLGLVPGGENPYQHMIGFITKIAERMRGPQTV